MTAFIKAKPKELDKVSRNNIFSVNIPFYFNYLHKGLKMIGQLYKMNIVRARFKKSINSVSYKIRTWKLILVYIHPAAYIKDRYRDYI